LSRRAISRIGNPNEVSPQTDEVYFRPL